MEKGQIVSLDLFIAVLVFTVAIAYILQSAATQQNTGTIALQTAEGQLVAENAGNLLAGNPDIECMLVDADYNEDGPITYLLNTINPKIQVSKSDLGIPLDYKCKVTGIKVVNCVDSPGFFDNVYSVTRLVKKPETDRITTKQLKQEALGNTIKVTIQVWK